MKKRTSRRKKVEYKDLKVISYKTNGEQLCKGCNTKQYLYYYEEKNILNKSLIIYMCRNCLEKLKFKLLEISDNNKVKFNDNIINIINKLIKGE